ncbi:DUF6197 family protein [Streptomyces sp. NPDC055085]
MTPEELLLAAIDIIQRDGWHQGDLYKPPATWKANCWREACDEAARTAPTCAMGALFRAAHGTSRWVDLTDSALGAVSLLQGHLGTPMIPHWNDAPERTAEDVILAMKRAAHHDS